jgi:hypothetical protein
MDNDIPISEPRAFHKFLNLVLMLFNAHLALALYSILTLTRSWHIGVDPSTGAYTAPPLAEFFLKKEFIIVPIFLLVLMIYKEFKIKLFRKRVQINLLVSACILAHAMFIAAIPFIFSLV